MKYQSYRETGGYRGDQVKLKDGDRVGTVLYFDGGSFGTPITVVRYADGTEGRLQTDDLVLVKKGPNWGGKAGNL